MRVAAAAAGSGAVPSEMMRGAVVLLGGALATARDLARTQPATASVPAIQYPVLKTLGSLKCGTDVQYYGNSQEVGNFSTFLIVHVLE